MSIYPISPSPQLRMVNKSQEIEISIVRDTSQKFLLQYFDYLVYSEQAEQDLVIQLLAGNQVVWRSGKFITSGVGQINFPEETRESNLEGYPYYCSSSNSKGQCDNFSPMGEKMPRLFPANIPIILKVKNRSNIYSHPIQIVFQGLLIS